MSHPEQLAFVQLFANSNVEALRGVDVLEVGSWSVYGDVRNVFNSAKSYVGLDLSEGPGVDLVASGHQLPLDIGDFDVAISCEAFEHDPDWQRTLSEMIRVTRPGGAVVLTAAGPGRPEHGTRRTLAHESPGSQELGWDHYHNVDPEVLESIFDRDSRVDSYAVFRNETVFDVYAIALLQRPNVESSRESFQIPSAAAVQASVSLTGVPYRIARLPLYLAYRIFGYEGASDFSRIYWTTISRLLGRARRTTFKSNTCASR